MVDEICYHLKYHYRGVFMPPQKKSKHVEFNESVDRDELAIMLQEAINKSNKDGVLRSYIQE